MDEEQWLQSWVWANFEPWFTGAATGAKDVVVVLDVSGSMQGNPYELGRLLTDLIVGSLSARDRVAVILLGWTTTIVGCDTEQMVQATETNKAAIRGSITDFGTRDRANFVLGVDAAFDLLDEAWLASGETSNRSQTLMWLSDGGDKDDKFGQVSKRNTGGRVRVFTFLMGQPTPGADDTTAGLRNIACDNRGQFRAISTLEALHTSARSVLNDELARNRNTSLSTRELMVATAAYSVHSAFPQRGALLPSEWTLDRKAVSLAAPIYVNSSAKRGFGYEFFGAELAAVATIDLPFDTLAVFMEGTRRNSTPNGIYPVLIDTSGMVMYHPLLNGTATDGTVPRNLVNVTNLEPALSDDNVTAILAASETAVASLRSFGPIRLLRSERDLSGSPLGAPVNASLRFTYRRLTGLPYILILVTPDFVYPVEDQINAAAPLSSTIDAVGASGADSYVRLQQRALCSGSGAVSSSDVSSTTATNCDGSTVVTLAAREAAYLTQPWTPTFDDTFNASSVGPFPTALYSALTLSTPAGLLRVFPAAETPVGTPSVSLEEATAMDTIARASYRNQGAIFGVNLKGLTVPYVPSAVDFQNWDSSWLGLSVTASVTVGGITAPRSWATVAAKMTAGWLNVTVDAWLDSTFAANRGVVLLVNIHGTTIASSSASTDVDPDLLFSDFPDVVDLMISGGALTIGSERSPVAVCASPIPELSSAASILHDGAVGVWRWTRNVVSFGALWMVTAFSVIFSSSENMVAGQDAPYILPVETCLGDTPSFALNVTSDVRITSAATPTSGAYLCSGTRVVQVVPLSGTSLFAIIATGRGIDCASLPPFSFARATAADIGTCGVQSPIEDTTPTPTVRVDTVVCAASMATPSLRVALLLTTVICGLFFLET